MSGAVQRQAEDVLTRFADPADTARLRRLFTQLADRIRDQDPREALQLGVAASQFDAGPQTRASLQQSLTSTSHFRTLRGRTGAVYSVAFAPDGRTLATAGGDNSVILWELPRPGRFSGNDVREACLRAGGPLDETTWNLYAPGVSYQDSCRHR